MDLFEGYPTGVTHSAEWSLKTWWSVARQQWLVQVEHHIPERGGWIRAWLINAAGNPRAFASFPCAVRAIERFLDEPDWTQCREFPGGVE